MVDSSYFQWIYIVENFIFEMLKWLSNKPTLSGVSWIREKQGNFYYQSQGIILVADKEN